MPKRKPAPASQSQQAPETVRLIKLADKAIDAWDGMADGEAEVTNELDDLVIDVKLAEARKINNDGLEKQIDWLVANGAATEVEALLIRLAQGPQADGTAVEEEEGR